MINELILFYWERRFEKNELHFNNNIYISNSPSKSYSKYETFPATTNNNADANQNGNILRMGKSVQPFPFVSCYFLSPTSTEKGGLKFPRQRLAKRKASKQFAAAKCADGTMSPLIESGGDLCISGGRLSFSNLRVHATPVHGGLEGGGRRLCANHFRRRGMEKQRRKKSVLLPRRCTPCISPRI